MGVGGGLLLVTIQAALADHHGEHRTVALAEANVAASVAYVVLIGVLSLAAALHAGWRIAVLASLAVPLLAVVGNRRLAFDAPPPRRRAGPPRRRVLGRGRDAVLHDRRRVVRHGLGRDLRRRRHRGLHRRRRLAHGRLLRGRGGRARPRQPAGAPPRPVPAARAALGVSAAGFAVLWPATTPAQALVGLSLLGIGLGNLFPMGIAVTVALAPERAALASGRAVATTSSAVLLAPLAVGGLADATSLQAALGVVPVALALAAACLAVVDRRSLTGQ